MQSVVVALALLASASAFTPASRRFAAPRTSVVRSAEDAPYLGTLDADTEIDSALFDKAFSTATESGGNRFHVALDPHIKAENADPVGLAGQRHQRGGSGLADSEWHVLICRQPLVLT